MNFIWRPCFSILNELFSFCLNLVACTLCDAFTRGFGASGMITLLVGACSKWCLTSFKGGCIQLRG
uniref:AlNc14C441G11675 protein n=1 Tax=Albugo laibachii Nc14 TaxID=890382 RepID=F0WZT4_9STRA|nr:AlNc14C441G11675 [Albugo laibachii Nc14]|eukprot:CCA27011.1 AlNc14C441G11675 [Albugo laibachii Nc14]